MDVYEELEVAKAEIEKLKVELRDKTNSLQNLKKSYDAQANHIQKAIFKVEKLNQELLQKAEEINEAKQIYECLNVNLNYKESNIKCLSAANDKHGSDCDEKAACLMRQVEFYGLTKELQHLPQNELDMHKEMLEESTRCQSLLKEEVLQMEISFKEELKKVYDALERANIELDETICERSEMEFELQIWKSFVKHLKNDLEENHVMRKELEKSLLSQVEFSESLKLEIDSLVYRLEEKENKIDYLKQHVFLFEQEPKVKETKAFVPASEETAVSYEPVEGRYLQIIEEKDRILEELQKVILRLEQESFRRELESDVIAKGHNMEITNELEKENPMHFTKGESMKTDDLMQQVNSLEQKYTSLLISVSSQLAEKQAEINQVQEACDMITAAEVLAALEIEEKKLMIEELEDDIHEMEKKLKLQEENWSQTKELALDIEAEMDAKLLKIKELTDQMENKLRGSDAFLQKIKLENRSSLENATRLSSERENCHKMCECTTADTQLMDTLRSLVQSFENDCLGMNFKKDDDLLVKENMIMHSPTGIKKPETFSYIRSPLKEPNNYLQLGKYFLA
ncbi:uncharacterized protein At4g38062-like [Abrus precatorius]|uniref:Uncharacterized protein At4g38062-like n=1 Tax=Abrus precatorius TaxID=3816 RepID=A0A8B8M164_ABRPR|nr:uncharacterized protein At4g38062-like [Abrus precatorius]